MSNKVKIILVVVFIFIVFGVIYFLRKRKQKFQEQNFEALPPISNTPTAASTTNLEANDSFPLKKGSKGNNVVYLQNALNKFSSSKITADGVFGEQTYNKILTTVNASSYPVTVEIFTKILQTANAK